MPVNQGFFEIINHFTPKIIAKTLDGATLYALCTRKLGLAVTPFLPIQQLLHVKAIPFLGNYNWEIYGCYEKKQQNHALIQELETYLENELGKIKNHDPHKISRAP